MRFSTVFISSAVVLAGMSTAFAIEKDDMLMARFADSDFEIEARGFDEEAELYARGGALSRLTGNKLPSYRDASRDPPPRYTHGDEQMAPPHVRQAWNSNQRPADYSNNHKSPSYTHSSNPRHHGRRSYDDELGAAWKRQVQRPPQPTVRPRPRSFDDDELVARGNIMSSGSRHSGDKERKDGKPPKYKVAKNDPPPRYEGSPNHIPHLDSFQRETDYTHNHKSPSHTQHHRRSFYDLD